MKEIEDVTGGCLKFRPKTDVDHGWIRINGEKGVRCSADLGYQEGGKQNVNLEASRCVGDAFKKKYLLIRRHCIVGCLWTLSWGNYGWYWGQTFLTTFTQNFFLNKTKR